ncbi:hypothetical protein JW916_01960 [Candidatus Sumerlaeota bacterium]|nr:hypothetical protein [Candidatus Sumerlaeota bacterium]
MPHWSGSKFYSETKRLGGFVAQNPRSRLWLEGLLVLVCIAFESGIVSAAPQLGPDEFRVSFMGTDGNRNLYARDCPAGPVSLGANRDAAMRTGPSMYSVVIAPVLPPPVRPRSKRANGRSTSEHSRSSSVQPSLRDGNYRTARG